MRFNNCVNFGLVDNMVVGEAVGARVLFTVAVAAMATMTRLNFMKMKTSSDDQTDDNDEATL
jgi:hypothetical protein